MTEVMVLREYAEFRATRAFSADVGSATDVNLIDIDADLDEGGTERQIALPELRKERWWFPSVLQVEESVSSVGDPGIVDLVPGPGGARFFANMGDFTTLDELRTPEGQIRRQIRSLGAGSRLAYYGHLARRLEFLIEAMEEEGESWAENSPESLRTMLLFLQSQPYLRYPQLTITPAATFRVQWIGDTSGHFAADFLPDGQVRFVVFCPDPRHPDRIQRVSGLTSWENVITAVEPYNVLRWAVDARP
jgi:hypothetical protein